MFSSKKKRAATFFKRKVGGAEFFTRGKFPKTRPRYPVNFGRSLIPPEPSENELARISAYIYRIS